MMRKFCDNPGCQFHADYPEDVREIEVTEFFRVIDRIKRYPYERPGKARLFLCSVCNAAAQIAITGEVPRPRHGVGVGLTSFETTL